MNMMGKARFEPKFLEERRALLQQYFEKVVGISEGDVSLFLRETTTDAVRRSSFCLSDFDPTSPHSVTRTSLFPDNESADSTDKPDKSGAKSRDAGRHSTLLHGDTVFHQATADNARKGFGGWLRSLTPKRMSTSVSHMSMASTAASDWTDDAPSSDTSADSNADGDAEANADKADNDEPAKSPVSVSRLGACRAVLVVMMMLIASLAVACFAAPERAAATADAISSTLGLPALSSYSEMTKLASVNRAPEQPPATSEKVEAAPVPEAVAEETVPAETVENEVPALEETEVPTLEEAASAVKAVLEAPAVEEAAGAPAAEVAAGAPAVEAAAEASAVEESAEAPAAEVAAVAPAETKPAPVKVADPVEVEAEVVQAAPVETVETEAAEAEVDVPDAIEVEAAAESAEEPATIVAEEQSPSSSADAEMEAARLREAAEIALREAMEAINANSADSVKPAPFTSSLRALPTKASCYQRNFRDWLVKPMGEYQWYEYPECQATTAPFGSTRQLPTIPSAKAIAEWLHTLSLPKMPKMPKIELPSVPSLPPLPSVPFFHALQSRAPPVSCWADNTKRWLQAPIGEYVHQPCRA